MQGAGGEILPQDSGNEAELIVIADQRGFAPQRGMDRVLSRILRRLDRGDDVELILCKPDLIYPLATGPCELTAGALAAMLEAVLQQRHPERTIAFTRQGKHTPR